MITDLIANGQIKIDEAQRLHDAEAQRQHEEVKRDIDAKLDGIAAVLTDNFPPELLIYIGRCTDVCYYNHNDIFHRIEVPECTAVSFKVVAEYDSDEREYRYSHLGQFSPHEYSEDRDRYTYQVDVPIVVQDEEHGYIISYNTKGVNDLEIALAYAHAQLLRLPELQTEADEKNAKLAEKQARKQQKAEAEAREQAEADAELAGLMADPLIGPLLQLVNAIVNERADLNQRISDMNAALDSSEYYHSEAMSRLERRVNEEAQRRSDAEREAENARYEASDAEAKLRKATKRTGLWA